MRRRHVALVTVLAGAVLIGTAVPVLGGLPADNEQQPQAAQNQTVGLQVAAFMQSTAADANATVDSGLWEVAVNRSAVPDQAIQRRASMLDSRLSGLRDRIEQLRDRASNGSLNEVAYTARASALRSQIANLKVAVNRTAETAKDHGANLTVLDRLRSSAANMSGPEVAATARNITDAGRGPPPGVSPGPPDDAGPPFDDDDAGPGQSDNASGPTGNQSDGGPPDDRGPPEDVGPPRNDENRPGNVSHPEAGDDDPADGENETDGRDEQGPPGPPGDGSPGDDGNGSEGGPPDDRGPPSDGAADDDADDDAADRGPPSDGTVNDETDDATETGPADDDDANGQGAAAGSGSGNAPGDR